MTEGIERPNQEKIRMLREMKIYKYLGILEADTIKHAEMKEKQKQNKKTKNKNKKEYIRKTRKLLEPKLHSRNFIKGINTWAVLLVRYSGLFLK